ncbi:MAG: hypothetical protein IPN94_19400 [Sphingobacteriales bacterium]|nr:hypothetical protein [Sphingobacteriales bacterium]
MLAKNKRHVFFSPFLQKGDRLRFLLAKNKQHVFFFSLFTKGRQLTAFACKSRKQRDFPPSLFTKGDSFPLFYKGRFCNKAVSRGILTKQLAQKLAQDTKKYKKNNN